MAQRRKDQYAGTRYEFLDPEYELEEVAEYYNLCQQAWDYCLPDLIDINWCSHSSPNRRFGTAYHKTRSPNGHYTVSVNVDTITSHAEKHAEKTGDYDALERLFKETVVHELAHIAQWIKWGRADHGRSFKHLMGLAGYLQLNRFIQDDAGRS